MDVQSVVLYLALTLAFVKALVGMAQMLSAERYAMWVWAALRQGITTACKIEHPYWINVK